MSLAQSSTVDAVSSSSPVALAFAVAALQSAGGEATTVSLRGGVQEMTGNPKFLPCVFQQHPGSGSDSREDTRRPVVSVQKRVRSEEADEDPEEKLARSRERNREHARKTRLRKKAQLEALQSKAKGLEAERQVLKQQIEECSIASILLGLSAGGGEPDQAAHDLLTSSSSATSEANVPLPTGSSSRRRFIGDSTADQEHKKLSHPLKLDIDGEVALIGGGKSHINWKTGSYVDAVGNQKRLTLEQLEHLRRERNRMHAKMTRDRKKCFIATMARAIEDLEADIDRMKNIISKVSHSSNTQFQKVVTPATSPSLQPATSPCSVDNDDESSVYSAVEDQGSERSAKRSRHGFSLGNS